jgi:hypothetical protein
MGAWGAGSFENDTALDWVWDLQESTDLGAIEAAISDVLDSDDYLDADVGCIGLAAAEVIAALRGKPADDLPEEVSQWAASQEVVPNETLVRDCLAAVDKIRNDDISELKELWEEDEDLPTEWHVVLDDLTARLE